MASNLLVFLLVFIGSCSSESKVSGGWSSSSSCPGYGMQPEVAQTPGILGNILPYRGHHECTDAGVCALEPLNCPWSPCCLTVGNTTANSTVPSSRCGCLNEKGVCVPFRSFRVGWITCGSGLQLEVDYEISKLPCDEVTCSGSTASVQFAVNTSGQVTLNIDVKSCPRAIVAGRGTFTQGGFLIDTAKKLALSLLDGLYKRKFVSLCGRLLKEMPVEQILENLESKQLQSIKSWSSNTPNALASQNLENSGKVVSKECVEDTTTFFSMSPSFQTGVLDIIQKPLNSKFCSASGQCKNTGLSHNNCTSGKMCCAVGKQLNSQGSNCECISGINSCLENKQLHSSFEVCTEDGGSVSSSTNIRVLLDGKTCEESEAEFDMDMDGSTRIKVVVRVQKCVPMAAGSGYVHVKHIISVVQDLEKFLPTLKAYVKSLDVLDLSHVLGEDRAHKIGDYLEHKHASAQPA